METISADGSELRLSFISKPTASGDPHPVSFFNAIYVVIVPYKTKRGYVD